MRLIFANRNKKQPDKYGIMCKLQIKRRGSRGVGTGDKTVFGDDVTKPIHTLPQPSNRRDKILPIYV
jgi:hypothetical protein